MRPNSRYHSQLRNADDDPQALWLRSLRPCASATAVGMFWAIAAILRRRVFSIRSRSAHAADAGPAPKLPRAAQSQEAASCARSRCRLSESCPRSIARLKGRATRRRCVVASGLGRAGSGPGGALFLPDLPREKRSPGRLDRPELGQGYSEHPCFTWPSADLRPLWGVDHRPSPIRSGSMIRQKTGNSAARAALTAWSKGSDMFVVHPPAATAPGRDHPSRSYPRVERSVVLRTHADFRRARHGPPG